MKEIVRESGIDIISNVPWGTHFCQFYKTKEDLIDILVPYFKAGLKNNEFCMWVTSEPLGKEEAKRSLGNAIPDFDKYLRTGQIEIIPYTEWYLKDSAFEHERVLKGWLEKLNKALGSGYEGLRLSGNTFWLEKTIWGDFANYELEINNGIGKFKMIAICTYSLDKCGANEILDVVNTHQFALIKREGEWNIIESPELKEAKLALKNEIAERKRAEEALRESEQRWATTLTSIGDAVIATDVQGRITFMNAVAEELTGWMFSEASTRPVTEVFKIINEQTHRTVEDPVAKVLEKGMVVGMANHTLLVRKDKTEIPIDDSGAPIKSQDGKTTGVVLVFRDITERKQVEVTLRKAYDELELRVQERTADLSNVNEKLEVEIVERRRAEEAAKTERQRLYDVLETMPAMICLLTPDCHVAFSNRSFRERFGESHGRHCYEYCFGSAEPCEFCETYKVLETGQPHHWEITGQDGSVIDAYDFPFIDVDGSRMILEMDIDITERKKAEEKIREQATLIDNTQEAVGVRNLEHVLIYWNKGAEHLYGWTGEEAIGKNADELVYKEESPQLIEAKRIVLEKGEWAGELHQITKDSREVIVESHWTLICDNEGKPKSILVVNTDITEKKVLESELLRAHRMESIGRLAGGIAHDLNNMLTPMMLSLQMLKEKFTDENSQKLLTILEKNSERSADLIKQVLSFSRGVEVERNPLAVNQLITEIEKIAKETFPRNIEIRTYLEKDLSTILGDATQLHQVIMNLCVNARDAMQNGGILKISAENFFIDENYARMHMEAKIGSYIAISVSDTGIGIPPKIIDRIFEPFFTTKEFGKGTGLGLSTALAIAKSHGGFISVYSEVGKGSTFSVYLPAIKTEMQKGEEEQLELLSGNGELILVAEDEDSVREVTVSTLEVYGYNVLAAKDGADAVALYAQNNGKIKAILMDMMMPFMDGEASIRAIRKINPHVKIIAVSGLAEKDKLAKIESTRVRAFLPKPYTAEKLLKAMHDVLSTK